jgi:hypothetical protein
MRPALALLLVALLSLAPACSGRRATAEDCARILDRIVELELRERGYRDPVLLERKRRQLRAALGAELEQCRGQRLRAGALECVKRATGAEEISHRCLR